MKKFQIVTHTDGEGLWSNKKREVLINELTLTDINIGTEKNKFKIYGYLNAYFSCRIWDVDKHGLIYTDQLWLKEFRRGLMKYGFSQKAVNEINYTEQGAQGGDFVNLSCGHNFIREFIKINKSDYGMYANVDAEFMP